MVTPASPSVTLIKARIKRVQRALREESRPSALLLTSSALQHRTADQYHPFRQESDFFYLTGSSSPGQALLLLSSHPRPILFSQKQSALSKVWDGPLPSPRPLSQALGADLVERETFGSEIKEKLRETEVLFHQDTPGSLGAKLAQELSAIPSHQRLHSPHGFCSAAELLQPLRLIKDAEELKAIRRAASITLESLKAVMPLLHPGNTEQFIAHALEHQFRMRGAGPAFGTIVGTGSHGATLHHTPSTTPLKSGELVLIDCGAEFGMYAGDMTRVFPVSGSFTAVQRDVYEIVRSAATKIISRMKPGVSYQSVQDTAVRILTEGLKDLGVLKGALPALIEKKAYQKYFPHRFGHSLGLDVHDPSPFRAKPETKLRAGMVLTVEPGLYFARRTGAIPPLGIRIEDDVVITPTGARPISPDPLPTSQAIEREISTSDLAI